jgi:hypothetical protein
MGLALRLALMCDAHGNGTAADVRPAIIAHFQFALNKAKLIPGRGATASAKNDGYARLDDFAANPP